MSWSGELGATTWCGPSITTDFTFPLLASSCGSCRTAQFKKRSTKKSGWKVAAATPSACREPRLLVWFCATPRAVRNMAWASGVWGNPSKRPRRKKSSLSATMDFSAQTASSYQVGGHRYSLEAITIRLEAITIRLGAVAIRLEAIAIWAEAITNRLEATL